MDAGSGVPTGPVVDTFTKLEKVETEGLAESKLMASRFPVRGSDGERKLPLGSTMETEN